MEGESLMRRCKGVSSGVLGTVATLGAGLPAEAVAAGFSAGGVMGTDAGFAGSGAVDATGLSVAGVEGGATGAGAGVTVFGFNEPGAGAGPGSGGGTMSSGFAAATVLAGAGEGAGAGSILGSAGKGGSVLAAADGTGGGALAGAGAAARGVVSPGTKEAAACSAWAAAAARWFCVNCSTFAEARAASSWA